jgi:hypothetical protein
MTAERYDLVIAVFLRMMRGLFRLMTADGAGIDWNGEEFLVARSATLESAWNYAKGLAEILWFRVPQIAKT